MLAKKRLLNDYRIGRTLGEGAFSKVKLATHRVTGKKMAIKIIKKDEDDKKKEAQQIKEHGESPLNRLSKEVKLLMRLDHPNIIRLHQVIDTEEELYIIMDYASGGELIDHIAAKSRLPEKEGRRIFRQLLSAIDHCHMAGVIHRDLKLENMLLSADKDILLSDFGLGRAFDSRTQLLNTFCGTPLYASPELVSGIHYHGPPADIWSLGIVLYIMTAGKPPFRCETISELYAQIKGVKYACPDHFSPELKTLLTKILVKDPSKRATMDDLRSDAWVNTGETELPLRLQPKAPIDAKRDTELPSIDTFVSYMEKYDGFVVYNFGSSPVNVKFDQGADEMEQPQSPTSPTKEDVTSSGTDTSGAVSLSALTSGRRMSWTQTLTTKFNIFKASKTQEDYTPGQQRQRSRSIAPTQTGPVAQAPVGNVPASPSNHTRRHSYAVGNRPRNEEPPSSPSDNNIKAVAPVSPTNSITVSHSTSLTIPPNSRSLAPSMEQINEEEGARTSRVGQMSTSKSRSFVRGVRPSPSFTNSSHDRRMSVANNDAAYMEDIRSIKFSLNMTILGTKTQFDVIALVDKMLTEFKYRFDRRGRFTFICHEDHPMGLIVIEVEVCKVWLLNVFGVRIKRLNGDALVYRSMAERMQQYLKAS